MHLMSASDKIHNEGILYVVFALVLIVFMLFDLGVFHRKDKEVSFQEALFQSMMWVALSFGFNILVYKYIGKEEAYQFLTAYVTEKSLSVDNIFVFVVILNYFAIQKKYYHKILVYGVLGAVVFRAIFIFLGGVLVNEFHWILYFFGAVLVYTSVKLFFSKEDDEFDPEKNIFYKFLSKRLKFSTIRDTGKFVVMENGQRRFTILILVIAVIESSDILFALDSIPAVFSISQDTFIVYTSNIFAVMGLRAMFFLLRSIVSRFSYLQQGISLVLFFIGAKMLAEIFHVEVASSISLMIILVILIISVILSIILEKKVETSEEKPEIKE